MSVLYTNYVIQHLSALPRGTRLGSNHVVAVRDVYDAAIVEAESNLRQEGMHWDRGKYEMPGMYQ